MSINPTITKEMIHNGIEQGLINFKPNTIDGYEVVCWIGGNWFYFAGQEGESMLATEYLEVTPKEDLETEIFETLNSFPEVDCLRDEYLYYAYYLMENLK